MFQTFVFMSCLFHIFVTANCDYDTLQHNKHRDDAKDASDVESDRSESSQNGIDSENEPFIPTHEWQKVKPGQAIPRGLHVKMDMTTGGKWAKLMDDESSRKTSAVVPIDSSDDHTTSTQKSENLKYDIKELKGALKNFKSDKMEKPESKDEEVKSKFRTIEEIRETFDQLKLHEESDFQVMKRLVSILNTSSATVGEKHLALQDLEYYVHQIDNANDLVNFGGFTVVIKAFNDSDVTIREEAAHVLGSAMQSNPKVQIEALKLGVLQLALSTLQKQHEPASLRKKCMFALSSLVRHFPLAQSKLERYGGFQVMLNFFREDENEQLQIKAIRLLNDLIEERFNAEKSEDDHYDERLKQYGGLQLAEFVKELGWCPAIASSLKMQQHGRRESVLRAMKTFHHYCRVEFQKDMVINDLKRLKVEYKALSDGDKRNDEADDSYFLSLYGMTKELLRLLAVATRTKDEF